MVVSSLEDLEGRMRWKRMEKLVPHVGKKRGTNGWRWVVNRDFGSFTRRGLIVDRMHPAEILMDWNIEYSCISTWRIFAHVANTYWRRIRGFVISGLINLMSLCVGSIFKYTWRCNKTFPLKGAVEECWYQQWTGILEEIFSWKTMFTYTFCPLPFWQDQRRGTLKWAASDWPTD